MPDVIETLTAAIAAQETALRESVPAERQTALVALVRAQDRLLDDLDPTLVPPFDAIHGSALANPGGSLALSLVLGPDGEPSSVPDVPTASSLDAWASPFLAGSAALADARQVLAHLATGFMRGEIQDDGTLAVRIARKRLPPTMRERIDLAWWAAHEHRHPADDTFAAPSWQFGYLPAAEIAGHTANRWMDAVRVLTDRYGEEASPVPERDVRATLADRLAIAPDEAADILAGLTLDATSAGWHATVPGIASTPFVRIATETLMPSRFGLRSEPLLFLARELRRRDAPRWHNAAHQREEAFRGDLATAFSDKRFVHAPSRIQLRRDGGTLRTDIDAAIFDRKTGTLALFELKSQDPFARSPEELDRRRDSLLAANRQLSGILDWIRRHGPDEILDRIDHQTAKRFHVQRVLPFVLARTLVQFNDGPAPDKRAAWGTWPDVLRLHAAGMLDPTTGNPLQTLFTRLHGLPDAPLTAPSTDQPPRTISLGRVLLVLTAAYPT
ncbi:MAG: hypothetical protein WBA46_02140 [Thermomicrobiales bacterium]